MLQASPEFKGIKTGQTGNAGRTVRFKPALNSKGLRPIFELYPSWLMSFKPALNSKGLRRVELYHQNLDRELQASPEFKGIKTGLCACYWQERLQASPEFKGIKTSFDYCLVLFLRFKPALNSKGLRRFVAAVCIVQGFKPALNSKGLRPMRVMQHCTNKASSQP